MRLTCAIRLSAALRSATGAKLGNPLTPKETMYRIVGIGAALED